MRREVRTLFALPLLIATLGVPARAQDAPPPPLPLKPVSFPEFSQATLASGARVIMVENHEQPVVTVSLRIKSGSAFDPEGKEGLAAAVASLLNKGTTTRSAREVAEAIDFIGASFGAGAGEDWTSVTVTTTKGFLDDALEIMADVVLHPTFPDDELETERKRILSALQVELSQPSAVAERHFVSGIYGDHPYGGLMTESSVKAIGREDLAAFHGTHYRPNNALFVVAGDVDPDEMAERLDTYFSGWEQASIPSVTLAGAPKRASRVIHLYHKPGLVQAVVRIGHLMAPATEPDWVPLDVAVRVLGGGSTAWLFEVLRQEKGYTYGAYATTAKRVDQGYIQAWAEVRNEVTDSSLTEMLSLIDRIRSEPVPDDDLSLAKNSITGSFPRQIETPQQVAGQLATVRLRGLPDDYLETYRDRVAAVTAADVQQVANQHFHPDGLLIVVVGDATQIYDKLSPFGEVELFDVEGAPMTLADLEVKAADVALDPSIIQPITLVYGLNFQGNPVGEITTEVSRESRDGRDVVVSKTTGAAATMSLEQEVIFDAETFSGITSTANQQQGPRAIAIELQLQEGRVTGSVSGLSEEPREVDSEVVEGTILPGMDDFVIWLADLEEGAELSVPAFNAISGSAYTLKLEVVGTTTLAVGAGEFEAFEVRVSGAQGTSTVYARKEPPHIVLQQEPAGQPIVIELTEIR